MEWMLVTGAAQRLGIATIGIQIGQTKEAIGAILLKTSCRAVFITRSPGSLYQDICKNLLEVDLQEDKLRFPDLKFIIAKGENNQRGTLKLDDLYISACEDKVEEASSKVTANDICFICLTSGTTGTPKLVPYTHLRALNSVCYLERLLPANKTCRYACTENIADIVALMESQVQPLLYGMTTIYPSESYNLDKLLQAIQQERVTHFNMTSELLSDLSNSHLGNSLQLPSLIGVCFSGSPVPHSVLTHLKKKLAIDVMNAYGTTEIFDIACSLVSEDAELGEVIGKPVKGVEIKIVDNNAAVVGAGDDGELWVRSKVAFDGYYEDNETTSSAISSNGWFKTRDVGKVDVNGNLILYGRTQIVIMKCGINIYPLELESLLMEHPSIKSTQVIGIPDSRLGEDVCACVIIHDAHTFTENDMKLHCGNKCYKDSIPSYCLAFESFPMGVTGKVDRKKLMEIAIGRLKSGHQSR